MKIQAEIVSWTKISNRFSKNQLNVTVIDVESQKWHYLTIFEGLIQQFEMLAGGGKVIWLDYIEKNGFKNVIGLS